MVFEEQSLLDLLRASAAEVMEIQDTTLGDDKQFRARFRGRLRLDSVEAYARVSERFHALGYTALFRREGELDAIFAVRGVLDLRPSRAWVNVALFGLTLLSVLVTGGLYGYEGNLPTDGIGWLRVVASGWPFALSMLSILLAHEFGHYFAARHHKVAVTLPYFIPLPYPLSLFGNLGAVILLKSRPTNRRVLLDIGVAGPLAGFVVAIPILLYGLLTSPVQPIPAALPQGQGLILEGNSIVYVLAKLAAFRQLLPIPADYLGLPPSLYMLRYYLLGIPAPLGGSDVLLNQVAWAGWAGLLVTGLNLIPVGQLDGGHALYVLVGERARRLVPIVLGVLILLGFFWWGWFLWAAIISALGRAHAEPLDQITELDPPRKALAVLALILFVLVITPVPLRLVGG
jgi:membrane-associated protease RseP (regulator of RpoE activity)